MSSSTWALYAPIFLELGAFMILYFLLPRGINIGCSNELALVPVEHCFTFSLAATTAKQTEVLFERMCSLSLWILHPLSYVHKDCGNIDEFLHLVK